MDAVHAEFDTLVAQALACPDDRLHACLARLQEHLLSHFGQEDDWMRQTAFPAGDCHIEEHGKVLASGVQVLDLVAQGNLAIGRDFADRNIETRASKPEEMAKLIRDEMAQWGEVVKRSNIRMD